MSEVGCGKLDCCKRPVAECLREEHFAQEDSVLAQFMSNLYARLRESPNKSLTSTDIRLSNLPLDFIYSVVNELTREKFTVYWDQRMQLDETPEEAESSEPVIPTYTTNLRISW